MAPRQDSYGEQAGDVFVLNRWSSALRGGDFALGIGRATTTDFLKGLFSTLLGG